MKLTPYSLFQTSPHLKEIWLICKVLLLKSLKKLIKKNEIQRYKVNRYSEVDLDNYILGIEKNIGLKDIKLEDHFKKFGADYKIFIDATVINLKWNTLIYSFIENS